MSDILMGWPRTAPLPPTPRRVRAARQRATTVVDEVFAEFGRAVEVGEPHVSGLVDRRLAPAPKTSRRPRDPRPDGGAT